MDEVAALARSYTSGDPFLRLGATMRSVEGTTRTRAHRWLLWSAVLTLPISVGLLVAATPGWAAPRSTLFVDQQARSCSDSGPGSQLRPFCTISVGLSHATAGTTVQVATGTYRESPAAVRSGTAGAPIVLTAAPGATVVVTGGSNGLAISGWSWIVAQGLTITQTTGRGVYVSNATNVTIQNVTVSQTPNGNGIYVANSSAVTLSGNSVSYAGTPVTGGIDAGIQLNATNNSLVAGNQSDHNTDAGISLVHGSTGNELRGNTTFANARQYQRAAPGIDVRSPGNIVDGNVSYDNEDSGIQFYGAGNNVAFNNLCYDNGDHGIDTLNATNQVYVANTVFGNATAGIDVEGTPGTPASSNVYIANNISVNNGIGNFGMKGDIRVDVNSLSGSSMDYDLVDLYQSGTVIIWGNATYPSLAAAQTATGQESHGLQGNPLFRLPAIGDFRLAEGSPAIDSANASALDEPNTDATGQPRVDDPATANSGAGAVAYADRGAFEFVPPTGPGYQPPVAALTVSPTSGPTPLAVTLDASGSTSTDPIESYQFVFGDGITGSAQTSPVANYTYPCPDSGALQVTVIVTDASGLSSTASAQVTIPPGNLVCNPGFETGVAGWAVGDTGVTLTQVAGGHSGSYAAAVTNGTATPVASCTLHDAAPHWVATTGAATYQGSMWVRADTAGATLRLRFREYGIVNGTFYGSNTVTLTLSTSWQQVTVAYTANAPGNTYLEFSAYTVNAAPGNCFYADDASIAST